MSAKDEFISKSQDLSIQKREKSLSRSIGKLVGEELSEFDVERISESWSIMARLCAYIENLADQKSLVDERGEAVAFYPEMNAEIVHLEANLPALKDAVGNIGTLAEKAASSKRR